MQLHGFLLENMLQKKKKEKKRKERKNEKEKEKKRKRVTPRWADIPNKQFRNKIRLFFLPICQEEINKVFSFEFTS